MLASAECALLQIRAAAAPVLAADDPLVASALIFDEAVDATAPVLAATAVVYAPAQVAHVVEAAPVVEANAVVVTAPVMEAALKAGIAEVWQEHPIRGTPPGAEEHGPGPLNSETPPLHLPLVWACPLVGVQGGRHLPSDPPFSFPLKG